MTVTISDQDDATGADTVSAQVVVYQPTQFVICGGSKPDLSRAATIGQDVIFWGSQWSKQVTGGDYQANANFNGYTDTLSTNGQSWLTKPGNSNPP